jgi:hypothetical protein
LVGDSYLPAISGNLAYQLHIYNDGPSDEEIVNIMAHQDGKDANEVPIRPGSLPNGVTGRVSVASGDTHWLFVPMNAVGDKRDLTFSLQTAAGNTVRASRVDTKIDRRMALMRLSKHLNPWKKSLPQGVTVALIGAALTVVCLLVLWVGIITHGRSSYSALGSIAVAEVRLPAQYSTLNVGDPKAVASGAFTNTIFVSPSAEHWYSLNSHEEYSITAATWPSGQELELFNSETGYAVGPGCTVAKGQKDYCVGRYVSSLSLEQSLKINIIKLSPAFIGYYVKIISVQPITNSD